MIKETEEKDWEDFIEMNNGTPFHRYKQLKLYESLGAKFLPLGFFNNDELSAVIPVFRYKKGAGCPPLSGYSGLILKESYRQKSIGFIGKIYSELIESLKTKNIEIATNPDDTDARPLIWLGFRAHPQYTYVMELSTDCDKMLLGIDKKTRNIIKKGESFNTKISWIEPNDREILRFFEMWKKTHERSNLGVPKILDVLNGISKLPGFRMIRADFEGRPGAYSIILTKGKKAFYWLAASDEDFWQYKMPYSILWRTACDLGKDGSTHLDLMGCNVESIAQYKSGFSPILKMYMILKRDERLFSRLKTWVR